MGSIFSALLNRVYNSRPYVAQEDAALNFPLSIQSREEDLHRDLANRNNSRAGFVSACYRMCCLSRKFDYALVTSVVLMLGLFYTNMIYSIIKVLYELQSPDRTYPRFMHALELTVNFSIHGNYSILSRLMKVGREEVKKRSDGQMHISTKEKVLLVAEALFSRLNKLVVFSIITTLTRVDKDGVSGVSILCVAMLALLLTSLFIPASGFQTRHYELYPTLAIFRGANVHAIIHVIIASFAVVLSMFVVDDTPPRSVIFLITALFVVNQISMLYIVYKSDYDPNRVSAQYENVTMSKTAAQIYALILILRLDCMEPGLVHFFDGIRATVMPW